VAFTVTK